MDITIKQHEKWLIMKLEGQLNIETSGTFVEEVNQHVSDHHNILLNLEMVDYISSAGIQALYHALAAVQAVGGKLAIIHVQTNVKKILSIMDIESDIPIYDDEEKACNN